MMKCDIFICTLNRPKELIEILKSFKNLKGDFRLIVVDSSEKDKRLSRRDQKLCDQYIIDKNKLPLSGARNLAIKHAKNDFIAFTDDDCIVEENWLVELMKGFKNKDVMCCTGKTQAYKNYTDTKYEKMFGFGRIGKKMFGFGRNEDKEKVIKNKLFLDFGRIGHGNNMAFRKEVFSDIGLYNEKLGAGTGVSGEDLDMFYRILKNKNLIFYNPNAIIYHKHLITDDKIPKIAHYNGFGYTLFFKRYKRVDFMIIYIGMLLKYAMKYLFGDRKIEKQRLRGLLGLKWNPQN